MTAPPPPLHPDWKSWFNAAPTADPLEDDERIPQGGRDNTLASLAGSMRKRGFPEAAIRAALLVINETQCDPPLDERDVHRIARSVASYPRGAPELIDISLFGTIPNQETTDGPGDIYRLYADEDIDHLPDPVWLVKDKIPIQGFTVDYGPSGAYKSFYAVGNGMGIAAGTDCHGHPCRQGPVIYVLAEGRSGIKKRLRAWKKHHHLDKVPDFHLLPQAVPITNPAALEKLVRTALSLPEPPVLIIVDTLARSMPGAHENDTKDMSALIAAIDHVREVVGCGVHLIHHTGHDTSRERGNTALRGAADTMTRLTKDSKGLVTIKCDKQKDADEGPADYYRFEEVLLTDSGVLIPTTEKPTDDDEGLRACTAAEIAGWIASQPGRRATPTEIRHAFGISDGTLRNRRYELESRQGVVYITRPLIDIKNSFYVSSAPGHRSDLSDEDAAALEAWEEARK